MYPELLAPVPHIVHRVIHTHFTKHTGAACNEVASGAVTLVQRFGSAVNLNIHLPALVLDGVCQTGGDDVPVFREAPAPSRAPRTLPRTTCSPCCRQPRRPGASRFVGKPLLSLVSLKS